MSAPSDRPKRAVALDQMTTAERATFVRALAAATLQWAIADLERDEQRDNSDTATEPPPADGARA